MIWYSALPWLRNYEITELTPSGQTYNAAIITGQIETDNSGAQIGGSANGTGTNATFYRPTGLTIDSQGNLYIVDETGRVFQYTTNNVLYQIAGQANVYGFTNGAGPYALFNNPQSIAIDRNNNIYVADQNNNVIRKITITLTN